MIIVAMAIYTESYLIQSAFSDWEADPVGTTLITRPIAEVRFPKVSVCPPEGSNTILNADLVAVGNRTLTEEDRALLEGEVEHVFVHEHHMMETRRISAMVNSNNIPKLFDGTLVLGDDFDVKIMSMKGTIESPNYKELVEPDIFKQDLDIHHIVSFPHGDYTDLRDRMRGKELSMRLETESSGDGRVEEEVSWIGPKVRLHREPLAWPSARRVCQAEGGHLASYPRFKEWQQHYRVLQATLGKVGRVWLGGTDIEEENRWVWSDGTPWSGWGEGEPAMWYQGFGKDQGDDGQEENCLSADLGDSPMIQHAGNIPHIPPARIPFHVGNDDPCGERYPFLCSLAPSPVSANRTVSRWWTAEDFMFDSLHVWWRRRVAGWSLLDTLPRRMAGFRLEWGLQATQEQEAANQEEGGEGHFAFHQSFQALAVMLSCCPPT